MAFGCVRRAAPDVATTAMLESVSLVWHEETGSTRVTAIVRGAGSGAGNGSGWEGEVMRYSNGSSAVRQALPHCDDDTESGPRRRALPATTAAEAPRIRSLDGLRAVSIALVIYSHLCGTQGFPDMEPFHRAIGLGNVGHFGVRVFFVISGFLITSLLVSELRKTGTVRLGAFYIKRTFRIFPAFYLYVLAMIGLSQLGAIVLPWRDAVLALTYTINYQHLRDWHVGHAWSLSIEEQFYFLWPATLGAARVKRGIWIAAAVICGAPLLRIGWSMFVSNRELRLLATEAFPTVADSIMTGCLLSLARPRLDESDRYLRMLRSPLLPIAALAVIYAALRIDRHHPGITMLAGETAMNLGIALVIDRYVRYPDLPVGRFLNARPLVLVGMASYSLYLWQQPFLLRPAPGVVASVWTRFPQNLFLAAACAMASYHLVERPFLRLRARLFGEGKTKVSPAAVAVPVTVVVPGLPVPLTRRATLFRPPPALERGSKYQPSSHPPP